MSSYWSNTYQIYYHSFPAHRRNDTIKSVSFLMSDSLNFDKNNLKKNKELFDVFKNRLIK